jgi:FlaA1/EpsC-like NDP-sugar epimerase
MATVLFRGLTWRTLTLIAFETALLVGAVFLGAYLRLGTVAWDDLTMGGLLGKSLVISAVVQLCLYNELTTCASCATTASWRCAHAAGPRRLVARAGVDTSSSPTVIGRGVFLIAAAFVMIGVTAWRLVFEFAARHIAPRERILLVGTNQAAIALARELLERSELGVRIVGFVDPDPAKVATPILDTGITGGIDDIPRIVHEQKVDRGS